ncbi:MAG: TetR/AcrR family transcriptional regulator [Odoribacter sp.]
MMKEEIVYKAMELFLRYGVKSVSMEDIAKQLCISKKTLYGYFGNKEDILMVCVKYRIYDEGVLCDINTGLLDLLLDCCEHVNKWSKSVNQRVCRDICKYYKNVYLFLRGRMSNYAKVCKGRVCDGIQAGYIRKDTSSDLVYVFLLDHLSQLFLDGKCDLRDLEEELLASRILAFARGISTIKGRTYIDKELKKRMLYEIS